MTNTTYYTAEQVKAYRPTLQFAVFGEFSPNQWTLLKSTNDYQSAVQTTNFWDERVNVELIDLHDIVREEQAAARLQRQVEEAEVYRVSQLSFDEQIKNSIQKQHEAIEKKVNEVLRNY